MSKELLQERFESWYAITKSVLGDDLQTRHSLWTKWQVAAPEHAASVRCPVCDLNMNDPEERKYLPPNCLYPKCPMLPSVSPQAPTDEEGVRLATPSEALEVLKARLSEHLAPAEKRELEQAIAVLQTPIPMLLFCPRCDAQHVDAPEPEKDWTNPPHATHACKFCGHLWRPSNANTEGVEHIALIEDKHAERFAAARPIRRGPSAEGADWVPVPREPTEAMVNAGIDTFDSPEAIYRAMLSAAPRPDAGEGLAGQLYQLASELREQRGGATRRDPRTGAHRGSYYSVAADALAEAARALGREEKA